MCPPQDIHKDLEKKLTKFYGTEDTILYASCFDANAGIFETILTAEDAVISDSLNHASIIDGIRLCKAKRFRYDNCDMGGKLWIQNEAQKQTLKRGSQLRNRPCSTTTNEKGSTGGRKIKGRTFY